MSYAMAQALQTAVYARLAGDAALSALVGDAIFDARPAGAVPPLHVALGAEKVRDASDADGAGAVHDLTISVVGTAAGFAGVKAAAAAVNDALAWGALLLTRGRVLDLRLTRAQAARVGSGDVRRIDLIFRARLSDD
ncbi:Protein of unknown function [Loktanella fryxellensis]|uniref:DUF3168 domain-containing protein n=1 Tax=Loktanella fryxellensis TaxID=245187 RepID=A0A1H7YCV4_9RHOB|nr:DUF3168 domain-containing protein [Loktanella fryxellensis]SEM43960.1 Protein of unknown function [Loktanella fryxellensis]